MSITFSWSRLQELSNFFMPNFANNFSVNFHLNWYCFPAPMVPGPDLNGTGTGGFGSRYCPCGILVHCTCHHPLHSLPGE